MTKQRERLKVGATTRPQQLAGAIAKYMTVDHKEVEIVAVGAGAINQATKGQIMARRYLSTKGIDVAYKPGFETLNIEGKETTAIKWTVVEV